MIQNIAPRVRGDDWSPTGLIGVVTAWIPACAGMTIKPQSSIPRAKLDPRVRGDDDNN